MALRWPASTGSFPSGRPCFRAKDHRHPVVKLGAKLVRQTGNDSEAPNPFAGWRAPVLPEPDEGHQPGVGKRNGIRLLPGGGLLSFAKVIDWHKATAQLERPAEGRPILDPLSLGVDVRETDFDILGAVRHQASTRQVQAALAGPGIEPNDGELITRRGFPTWRDVRDRSMRRDGEVQPDLA